MAYTLGMVILGLLLATQQTDFLKSFRGLWATVNGQVLAVEDSGIHFIRGDRFYEAKKVDQNSEGNFYLKWAGSRRLTQGSFVYSSKYKKDVCLTYFHVQKADSPQDQGDGFIGLGKPDGRGIIRNISVSLKRDQAGSLLSEGFTYLGPISSVAFSGKYGDDLFETEFNETNDPKELPLGVFRLNGRFLFKGQPYVLNGFRAGLAGSGNLIDTKTNAIQGTFYFVWAPTPNRVLDSFNDGVGRTDNLSAFIYLNDKSFPTGTTRTLKAKK